ncbi:MAG TPA: di-heme oxidoredictase family protein [Steroidobacteraceae bacterium]|nr:di-heme oxidoredictase family protein [Steroidobacteraceae bacterium]
MCLWAAACSAAPRPDSRGDSAHAPPASPPGEAPAGFDNQSNGVTDAATHQADQAKFEEVEAPADGLGPLYNAQSCRECHQNPVSGGSSQVLELRVGHRSRDGSFQNPEIPINGGSEVVTGRSLVNQRAICPSAAFPATEIQERVPDTENVRTLRTSVTLLGDGFVEALADDTLLELSKRQCHQGSGRICGLALHVPVVESPGTTRIGRLGWKDQQASLLSFAGDAYLNEMGITNTLFPDEVTSLCNTAAEPNDKPGADGLADIDRFARFLRATKVPARDARRAATAAARKGAELFAGIGCDACHVPTLTTAPAGTVMNGGKYTVPPALGNRTFHPYSDFLLHDIGTGDGIVMAMQEHYGRHMYDIKWKNLSPEAFRSTANRMRTAPLWGVRLRPMLMHDGASLTFRDAILRHRGEAGEVTRRFERLRPADQDAIVEFLRSL